MNDDINLESLIKGNTTLLESAILSSYIMGLTKALKILSEETDKYENKDTILMDIVDRLTEESGSVMKQFTEKHPDCASPFLSPSETEEPENEEIHYIETEYKCKEEHRHIVTKFMISKKIGIQQAINVENNRIIFKLLIKAVHEPELPAWEKELDNLIKEQDDKNS